MDVYVPLRRMTRYFESELNKELVGKEFSYGLWSYIFIIGKHEGSSIKELCVKCGLDKGNSTRMVSKLMDMGVVEDRSTKSRTYSLYLTDKGKEAFDKATDALSTLCTRLFHDLSDDERDSLINCFAKISTTMSREYVY